MATDVCLPLSPTASPTALPTAPPTAPALPTAPCSLLSTVPPTAPAHCHCPLPLPTALCPCPLLPASAPPHCPLPPTALCPWPLLPAASTVPPTAPGPPTTTSTGLLELDAVLQVHDCQDWGGLPTDTAHGGHWARKHWATNGYRYVYIYIYRWLLIYTMTWPTQMHDENGYQDAQ